jgi:hypothetical protein
MVDTVDFSHITIGLNIEIMEIIVLRKRQVKEREKVSRILFLPFHKTAQLPNFFYPIPTFSSPERKLLYKVAMKHPCNPYLHIRTNKDHHLKSRTAFSCNKITKFCKIVLLFYGYKKTKKSSQNLFYDFVATNCREGLMCQILKNESHGR